MNGYDQKIIKYMVENNYDVIPDNESVKKQMRSEYTNDNNNDINGLTAVIKKLVKIRHLHDEDLNNIVWNSLNAY